MVNELDLAPPAVKPSKRELIVVALHVKLARDAIEAGTEAVARIRPVFINRLSESHRAWLIRLIESEQIVFGDAEHYALRHVKVQRGENFFVIARIPNQ
jgi:hypothetical protein